MTENATKIKTLSEFIEWANQLNKGEYLFRGVSSEEHEIEASTYRRLEKENEKKKKKKKDPIQLLNINKELLENARKLGHNQRNGRQLHDLELLAELQHYGAATCLIDFSRNTLIALWFACKKSDGNKRKGNNGKVSAIHYDDISVFKTVNTKTAEEDIAYFFKQEKDKDYPLYLWQPKHQNNRVIAQHSMFIFGGTKIPIDKECIIQANDKPEILNALEKLFNISEETMFPDFDGFARLNAHDKTWTEPDTEGLKKRAFELYQKGEYDNAIADYTKAIEHKPDDVEAYYNRGFLYAEKGEYDCAIADYDKVIELNPNLAEPYNNRGSTYAKKGEYDRAIADYDKAIALNPKYANAYNNRGNTYAKKGEYDRAIADYDKAIALNPNLAEPYNNRGNTYDKKGEYNYAITDYDKAIAINPNFADAYNNRGGTYHGKGEYDRAIADYDKAIALNPNLAEAYYNRGSTYDEKGEYDRAIADYDKAIALNPNLAAAYNGRGVAYRKKDKYDNAIKDYDKAIELNPNEPIHYFGRGLTHLIQENWQQAKADLITAKEKGANIVDLFHSEFPDIDTFQQQYNIQLPADIVALLTSE